MVNYNNDTLIQCCLEKNTTLKHDYSEKKLTSKTPIEYKCTGDGCEKTHTSKFSNFIKNKHAHCPSCIKKYKNKDKKIPYEKSIAHTHSEIAKQWHPTKNGSLKPTDVSHGSNKLAWFLCSETCPYGCPHEWQSIIYNAIKGNSCHYCIKHNSRILCEHEYLKFTHPAISSELHPTKNGDLTSDNVSFAMNINLVWVCPNICPEGCPHEYKTTPNNRTKIDKGTGCPFCSYPCQRVCIHTSISATHPTIAKEFHSTKNIGLIPDNIGAGSGIKIWWYNLECGHEWEAEVCNRTGRGDGCSVCVFKTEKKLYNIVKPYYPLLERQLIFEWCQKKRFDFGLKNNNIIIELDGPQHINTQVSNWASPEEIHKNDVYKMTCANENGYYIIRILQTDVLNDIYDWLTELRLNIENILSKKVMSNIFMCKNNEYDIFPA